jgi:hypothetical protein
MRDEILDRCVAERSIMAPSRTLSSGPVSLSTSAPTLCRSISYPKPRSRSHVREQFIS